MPIFCTNCGETIAEGRKFCSACGTKVETSPNKPQDNKTGPPEPQQITNAEPDLKQTAADASSAAITENNQTSQSQPQQAYIPPTAYAAPAYPAYNNSPASNIQDIPPAKGSKYAPMSTLGYLGWMILMCIPIIGLIVTIILSFSSSGSVNRRNFARAILILAIIGVALAIFSIISFWAVISTIFSDYKIEFGF